MGPSEKTFNQVKSILNKLDSSIDQLRQRRTAPSAPGSTPAPLPAPARPGTNNNGFGRATPIPPRND